VQRQLGRTNIPSRFSLRHITFGLPFVCVCVLFPAQLPPRAVMALVDPAPTELRARKFMQGLQALGPQPDAEQLHELWNVASCLVGHATGDGRPSALRRLFSPASSPSSMVFDTWTRASRFMNAPCAPQVVRWPSVNEHGRSMDCCFSSLPPYTFSTLLRSVAAAHHFDVCLPALVTPVWGSPVSPSGPLFARLRLLKEKHALLDCLRGARAWLDDVEGSEDAPVLAGWPLHDFCDTTAQGLEAVMALGAVPATADPCSQASAGVLPPPPPETLQWWRRESHLWRRAIHEHNSGCSAVEELRRKKKPRSRKRGHRGPPEVPITHPVRLVVSMNSPTAATTTAAPATSAAEPPVLPSTTTPQGTSTVESHPLPPEAPPVAPMNRGSTEWLHVFRNDTHHLSALATGVLAALQALANVWSEHQEAPRSEPTAPASEGSSKATVVGRRAALAFLASLLHPTLGVPGTTSAYSFLKPPHPRRFSATPSHGTVAAHVFACHATRAHAAALALPASGAPSATPSEESAARLLACLQTAIASCCWTGLASADGMAHQECETDGASNTVAAFVDLRKSLLAAWSSSHGVLCAQVCRDVVGCVNHPAAARRAGAGGAGDETESIKVSHAADADATPLAQVVAKWKATWGTLGTGCLMILRGAARQGKSTLTKRLVALLRARGVSRRYIRVMSRDEWLAKLVWQELDKMTKHRMSEDHHKLLLDIRAFASSQGLDSSRPSLVDLPAELYVWHVFGCVHVDACWC